MDLQVILLEVTETVEVNEIAEVVKPKWVGGLKGEFKVGSAPKRWSRRSEAVLVN